MLRTEEKMKLRKKKTGKRWAAGNFAKMGGGGRACRTRDKEDWWGKKKKHSRTGTVRKDQLRSVDVADWEKIEGRGKDEKTGGL